MWRCRKIRCVTISCYAAWMLLMITPIMMAGTDLNEDQSVTLDRVQDVRVKGVVKDQNGEPLAGVNVVIKGTTTGVISGIDGEFEITVPDRNAVLVFSYIGYTSQEIVVGNRQSITVTLAESASELDEVVVVGYGTQKKVNLSGAVQSISGKEMLNRPINNVSTGLQGMAANLNIENIGGRATSTASINIRGFTSINGGSVFILVDNVPTSAEELGRLNPVDIESVSVLKDASASAIYGSRAAYGVLLITTKKAKSKNLQVNFNAYYATKYVHEIDYETNPETILKMAALADYPDGGWLDPQIPYSEQITKDPSLPRTIIDPGNPTRWYYYGEYEWYNELTRRWSPSYNADVNVSKSTDNLSYYVSGGYYQQDGVMNITHNDIFKRYNLRANADMKLTNWWTLGNRIAFVNTDYERPSSLNDDYFYRLYHSNTMDLPYTPDGSYSARGVYIAYLEEGGMKDTELNETQLAFNTQIDLIKDVLQLKGDATFRWANTGSDSYQLPIYFKRGPDLALERAVSPHVENHSGSGSGSNSWAEKEYTKHRQTIFNFVVDFHKTFADKHFVSALAGYNQEYVYWNQFWVRSENLTSNSLPSIQLSNGLITRGESMYDFALQGLFFRANYIYDNKYIFEANGRYDGTSSYPPGKRWGFFPSGSVAWLISREAFFESLAEQLKVDLWKVRASYGALGNQTMFSGRYETGTGYMAQAYTNYYPYMSTMGQSEVLYNFGSSKPSGVYMPAPVSPNQTWEKVVKLNLGTDLTLLKNRLNLTFDWYSQKTIGMLCKGVTLPAVFGASVPRENAADLETKGWEVTLGWNDQFNVGNSPLSLGARFMISNSWTYITKYDNPTNNIWDYYVGKRIGEMWGLTTDGFFATDEEALAANQNSVMGNNRSKKAGDIRFKDIDGNGEISYGESTLDNPGDAKIIGNSQAQYPYSLDLSAGWHGFDLRLLFYGVGKKDWYPGTGHIVFWGVSNAIGDTPAAVFAHQTDYWREDNQDAYFPRPKYGAAGGGEMSQTQTKYLQDASYLRLRNLTIGYTLPQNLIKKCHLSNLRFYLSGENLWTLSHIYVKMIDPEILSGRGDRYQVQRQTPGYPFSQNYSFGINVSF